MSARATDRPRRAPRGGFTLIELLVVIFIIALLVAILAPAVNGVFRQAMTKRTAGQLMAIGQALESYKHDFGDYPPSEPDVETSYPGGKALVYYLNGTDGNGYNVGNSRRYPARVHGVKMSGYKFLDAWSIDIEYFHPYLNRGNTAADIYPRACMREYTLPDETGKRSGYGIQIPAERWLTDKTGWNDDYEDYLNKDWPNFQVPINATKFLLVSRGADGLYGTSDDVGNYSN